MRYIGGRGVSTVEIRASIAKYMSKGKATLDSAVVYLANKSISTPNLNLSQNGTLAGFVVGFYGCGML